MKPANRWPFWTVAAWAVWRFVYAVIACIVMAVLAPIVGLALWPAYQWAGTGWAVLVFAVVVFTTGRRVRFVGRAPDGPSGGLAGTTGHAAGSRAAGGPAGRRRPTAADL